MICVKQKDEFWRETMKFNAQRAWNTISIQALAASIKNANNLSSLFSFSRFLGENCQNARFFPISLELTQFSCTPRRRWTFKFPFKFPTLSNQISSIQAPPSPDLFHYKLTSLNKKLTVFFTIFPQFKRLRNESHKK